MNIPKLRFKEFTDEWSFTSFNEIFSILNGYAFSSKDFISSQEIILTKIANVDFNCMSKDNLSFLPKEYLNKYSKFMLNRNDIVIALTRPILNNNLKIAIVDDFFDKSLLNQRVGKIISKHNSLFVYYMLQTKKCIHSINISIAGTDPPNLSPEKITYIKKYLPQSKEQKKIANFLTTVDKKITNLENTITSLENQKKGLLQQIFSQKLRFKDKNGNNYPNWINSTIGKSGYFYYGKSAPKWSITDTATIPCVRYGELYTTHNIMVKKIYSYTNIPKENLKFSTGNEVLVPRVGEEPLDFCKCCYLPFKDVAIGEMISVYNTKNNPLFISYMFNATMKYKFAKLVEGGNVSNLYYSYLENIKIKLPCLEEQTKIADFLSAFDRKLENQKAQLEHWQQIKKGLLQQMFV